MVKLWMSASSNIRNLRGLLASEETLSLPLKVPQTGGISWKQTLRGLFGLKVICTSSHSEVHLSSLLTHTIILLPSL